MINPELHKKTTDILFDAYFNDTLMHMNCYACAVGNIIAGNLGIKFRGKVWDSEFFDPGSRGWAGVVLCGNPAIAEAKIQIESTGYSPCQLLKIERAFERADPGNSKDEHMFNGLVAVINVLNEIHEVEQDEQVARFRNHYETVKCH